ncbi:MAG: histidine kinase [Phycisphaerae bacterium]|nr:histidine kinase [Saprospiraceae bacterium]
MNQKFAVPQLPDPEKIGIKLSGSSSLLTILLCIAVLPAFAQKASPAQLLNPSTPQPLNSSTPQPILDKFSRYQHYTMEQGLSSNWVMSIAQDDDGFLWFATVEGLNRFDGERFTPFFYSADGKGLPTDRVTKLLALPGHRLLVGTEKGLCVLHTRSLEFQSLPLPDRNGLLKNDLPILKICRTRNGQIWVSAGIGIYLLDNQLHLTQTFFEPLRPGEAQEGLFALDFLELPDGTVAVKCRQALPPYNRPWQVIDFQNQKMEPLSQRLEGLGVLDTALLSNSVASDGQNNIWYTCLKSVGPTALYRFDWASRRAQAVLPNLAYATPQPHLGQFHDPFLLPDSLLFLQRYFGSPLIYNLRDGSITEIPVWKTSMPDGKGILNFVDRDGNLWLCPRFEGIFFLTLKNLPATSMTALNVAHKKRMKTERVSEEWFGFNCVEQAGKWVVSSGNGGLYSMDKATLGVSGAVLDNSFQGYAYVNHFAPDRGDTVWTNTLDGLRWYNVVRNSTGLLKERYQGLDSLDSRFIFRDHHGLIWGRVRNNGVCCFDTRSRQFTQFSSKGSNAPFPLISATTCTEGPDGDMWFSYGTEEKYLVRWRRVTGVFEKIEPRCPAGTNCTKAFALRADPYGNLWLYANQAWFIMDTKTLQVQTFGKGNGLITNDPQGHCLDRDGNAWLATAFGLSRYDPRSRQLRTFYQTDGLLSNTIVNVELIDTARNILFVSTDRGMCLFEPDKIGAAAPAPPTLITGLRVSDRPVPLPQLGALALPYKQNDLRIEFTGVNFINGTANRYQYSMESEGKQAEWKEAGTDNFANFLNLAPGRYTFRARTANSDGIWGNEEATLSIVIYPPWWQTWTFRLSLLFALAALVWGFYRRQIIRTENREKEKAQVRQQMADLEMKALRSQMNPHFVFNALNSVQNFILKNDTREASKYLTKFARLMRLILENSESPMVPLAREIELLRYYTELEQLRFNNRFTFDFQIDSNLNPESVSIPGMLIQPHIENAIWHGLMHKTEPGQLWIRFLKADEKTLVCEIEDNGVGRVRAAEIEKDRAKNHRSTGLANIRNRLDLLNAQLAEDIRLDFEDLLDEQGQARGTKVVVRMPLLSGT